jgi:hypothetical protein
MTVGGQDEKKGVMSRTFSLSSQDHDPNLAMGMAAGYERA